MPKKKQETADNKSLKKVYLFLAMVLVLIVLSFCVKFIIILQNSRYDGRNRFTISVKDKAGYIFILSASPAESTFSTVAINNKSKGSAGSILGILIDGSVEIGNKDFKKDASPSDIIFTALVSPQAVKKNLTIIDIFRIYLYEKSTQSVNHFQYNISSGERGASFDKTALQLFSDPAIISERQTIEIINGTGIEGLGRRLERIINNCGGNVIAVGSSLGKENTSKIYYFRNQTYTLDKLQQKLNYKTIPMQNRGVADIRIVIGEDGLREEVF